MRSVLIVTDHYLPGFKAGGPIVSLSALVDCLQDHFAFSLITRDKDFNEPCSYTGIVANQWIKKNNLNLFYFSSIIYYIYALLKTKTEVVYLNSFFSVLTIIALILNRFGFIATLFVLAPRGELSNGALEIKSFKKKLYLFFVKKFGLLNNVRFHATSENEKYNIDSLLKKNSLMLPNLITPKFLSSPALNIHKNIDFVKLVFFSRVSRKKNLDLALNILKKVTCSVDFDIWGPIEEQDYWQQCQAIITQLPSNVRVTYQGALPREHVQKKLAKYHALFLPTRNENFGHAIVECMAIGLLPIISDQTPWRALEAQAVGWDIPLSCMDDFVKAIHELSTLSSSEFQQRSVNCQRYIQQHSDIPLSGYIKLFSSIALS